MTKNNEDVEVEIVYNNVSDIKNNFQTGLIHPKNLKECVTNVLINMLQPIQMKFKELSLKKE
jgi:tryptophanyl-tRNA synthetase